MALIERVERTAFRLKRWRCRPAQTLFVDSKKGLSHQVVEQMERPAKAGLLLVVVNFVKKLFRAEVMGNLLGVCTNKQIRLLQDKLDERFPTDRIDFSRQLPRKISLHILKFLDPRSLSRCAQVSWYWKFLSESDELWRPKCLRFGWYPPYKPRWAASTVEKSDLL